MNDAVVLNVNGEVDQLQTNRSEICAFLYKECRLADESNYDEWEALLDDEMLYWVPLGGPNPDPDATLSIIADHKPRLHNRIAQLKTQRRLAQQPISPMRRLVSNIEISPMAEDQIKVQCNFTLHEFRIQATAQIQIWAGRYEYRLRRRSDGLKMFYKRVDLINAGGALPSLAFFRRSLSPEGMVQASQGLGGPQPKEVQRMLQAQRQALAADEAWTAAARARLASADVKRQAAFDRLLRP